MKPEVFINGRFLTQAITGVQRYAMEMVKEMDRLLGDRKQQHDPSSIVLIAPKDAKHELPLKHIRTIKVGRLTGNLWEQLELPYYTRGRLLMNLCNAAPILKRNQLVTIHDMAVFANSQAFSVPFALWYRLMMGIITKTTRKIVTVSKFSKAEIMKYLHVPEEKLEVIGCGHEHFLDIVPDRSILDKFGIDSPYILAVSSINPNKNFQSIVKAMELVADQSLALVIAGGADPRVFGKCDLTVSQHMKVLGYVSDGELKALYEGASAFVFPSFYEGFGIPPLEAMTCGCPIVVSNSSSLPEIGGDAALYCNPHKPEDIAEKMTAIHRDESIRSRLRMEGFKQILKFTWKQSARQALSLVERQTKKMESM